MFSQWYNADASRSDLLDCSWQNNVNEQYDMFVVFSWLSREDCPLIFIVFNLILTGFTPNHGKNSPFYYLKIK